MSFTRCLYFIKLHERAFAYPQDDALVQLENETAFIQEIFTETNPMEILREHSTKDLLYCKQAKNDFMKDIL